MVRKRWLDEAPLCRPCMPAITNMQSDHVLIWVYIYPAKKGHKPLRTQILRLLGAANYAESGARNDQSILIRSGGRKCLPHLLFPYQACPDRDGRIKSVSHNKNSRAPSSSADIPRHWPLLPNTRLPWGNCFVLLGSTHSSKPASNPTLSLVGSSLGLVVLLHQP